MPSLHETIVRPIVTEKSSLAYQDKGEYHFEVHPDANKPTIKHAVEQLFGVRVAGVWTSNQRGKARRVVRSRSGWLLTSSCAARIGGRSASCAASGTEN